MSPAQRLRCFVYGLLLGAAFAFLPLGTAKADTYLWTDNTFYFSTKGADCYDVSKAYADTVNLYFQSNGLVNRYGPISCNTATANAKAIGQTQSINFMSYAGGGSATATATTLTLSGVIADQVVSPTLPIENYPVQSVLVLCTGLVLFVVGFQIGKAL